MEIHILDKNTIDKIAAGEVVERPANVVKELMENSIDAGASAISVEIRDGGKTLIRITDNGCGIPAPQVRTAFLRHATSKIMTAEDLSFVTTLGFRGEALSSIAAVSDLELCTKTAGSLTGTIYRIRGGEEAGMEEAGLPDGTTIVIRDLFANIPARSKFLGSAHSEGNLVTEAVEKIALSHPEISFKFTNNGSVRLNTSGNGSLKDVIYSIYGRDMAANLLKVDGSCELMSVSGYIGKPEIQRATRNYEVFFVNGRSVRDRILSAAVEDAFRGYQMKGAFPFCVLSISIEPELMDVNVHPAKLEIRFSDNEAVFRFIADTVRDIIKGRESIPEFTITGNSETEQNLEKNIAIEAKRISIPEPFENVRRESAAPLFVREETVYMNDVSSTTDNSGDLSAKSSHEPIPAGQTFNTEYDINSYQSNSGLANTAEKVTYEQQTLFSEPFLGEKARIRHKLIGEVFDTYWIVEYDDKMYVIDQHAAHEKINYERFMNKIKSGKIPSQMISPGKIVTLSPSEEDCLKKYIQDFNALGFGIEHFGGSEYIINAVPSDFYGIESTDLFISFLDELNESPVSRDPEKITDRIATAACKASVKGGDRLSFQEADRMIDELLSLDNPYNCPHGRPTIITMSRQEMEKRFKRIL